MQGEIGTQDPRHLDGLEKIRRLDQAGVTVAEGDGSLAQKGIVWLAISISLAGLVLHASHSNAAWWVLPLVVLAIDFLSGFVHWFFDTQVEQDDSFLGRISIDFLDHHVRPQRTVDVGFFVSAYRPAAMVTLPLVVLSTTMSGFPVAGAILFWIGALSMWVPQTHKLAHIGGGGTLVRALQVSRMVLNPHSHQKHHADNSQSFCVFTGWLNPVLDRSRFWRGMEAVFAVARIR